jgi:Pentapeptide repeats (8 copies)
LLKQGVAAWHDWRRKNPDTRPDLSGAILSRADLSRAYLNGANLSLAILNRAHLSRARLSRADLSRTNLSEADLSEADLRGAKLREADLTGAYLNGAKLSGADLSGATLLRTDLRGADLTGCRIYGISAWDLKLSGATQRNLVITREQAPEITVDNIEIAQFIYLLLHNQKIRDVIDTLGKKGVLLLGRFTEGRIAILERLREELRKRGFLPIVFNFDKPDTMTFTQTVRLLAGMSRFVIADVTNPKPFAMLEDLWIQYRDWVFEPLYYSSLETLVAALDEKIIKPAEVRFAELLRGRLRR